MWTNHNVTFFFIQNKAKTKTVRKGARNFTTTIM